MDDTVTILLDEDEIVAHDLQRRSRWAPEELIGRRITGIDLDAYQRVIILELEGRRKK